MGQEASENEMWCQSAAVPQDRVEEESAVEASYLSQQEGLHRTALTYLTKISAERHLDDVTEPHAGADDAGLALLASVQAQFKLDGLPEHMYDVERVLAKTPWMHRDNAFHDTLNNDDAIRCPYVLHRPGKEGAGIDAVVSFGKAITGHPKLVHGGITALAFDHLLGWGLFLQGTGPVFTASLKVDYKAPLPCLTTAVVNVTVDRVEGRKLFATARLHSLDKDVLYATAEALFIKPKPK